MLIYFITINFFGFFVCGYDKRLACKHRYRISEGILFSICILGGGIGFLVGMYYFHHKTKQKRFLFGVPFFVLLWLICFYFL